MNPAVRSGTLLLIVALTACGQRTQAADAVRAATPVRVASVRQLSFSAPLELSGNVTAPRQAVVGALTAGRVVALYVQTGDAVVAGSAIARIDDAAYRASLAQAVGSAGAAQGAVAAARAQTLAARARLALAQTTAHRMAALYAEGAITKQQNDQAANDAATASAALEQAQAQVAAAVGSSGEARAAKASAEIPLTEAVVRAPFDGIILTRSVDAGAVVGPGSPIATVQDDNHLELDVAVPEAAALAVHPGMQLSARIEAFSGRSVAGTVRAILPGDNPALHSVMLKIELAPAARLYPGMFARVRLQGPARNVTAVPVRALAERADQPGVFAVHDDRAEFFPLRTGSIQNGYVEVRGLPSTIRLVAVDGVASLSDGAAVAIAR